MFFFNYVSRFFRATGTSPCANTVKYVQSQTERCILLEESSKSLKSQCCRFNKSFGEKVDGLIEHQSGPRDPVQMGTGTYGTMYNL